MKTKFKLKAKSKDSYVECITKFMPLASIKNNEHLDCAVEVIDHLLEMDRDNGEEMYLDALTDLVEVYEDKNVEIEDSSPVEMLNHLVEARGLTQAELVRQSEISKSTVSEMLSGKTAISKGNAFKLAEVFGVSPLLFIKTN